MTPALISPIGTGFNSKPGAVLKTTCCEESAVAVDSPCITRPREELVVVVPGSSSSSSSSGPWAGAHCYLR